MLPAPKPVHEEEGLHCAIYLTRVGGLSRDLASHGDISSQLVNPDGVAQTGADLRPVR